MIRKNQIVFLSGTFLLVLILVFSIFTTGCEKEKAERICAIFSALIYDGYQYAYLSSDPIANINETDVIIEWDTLSHTFPYIEYDWIQHQINFNDTLEMDTLKNYKVRLSSDIGDCQGTVKIPGGTYIIEPDYNDTLTISTATIEWSVAEGVDYYYIGYELDAYDSTASFIEWKDTFRFITDTSFTIPSSDFDIPDAAFYRVYAWLYSMSGAIPNPGESGNMSGSVSGFLSAVNIYSYDYIYFWAGEPVKKGQKNSHKPNRPTENDITDAYFNILGIEKARK